jgi:hypothetical protein
VRSSPALHASRAPRSPSYRSLLILSSRYRLTNSNVRPKDCLPSMLPTHSKRRRNGHLPTAYNAEASTAKAFAFSSVRMGEADQLISHRIFPCPFGGLSPRDDTLDAVPPSTTILNQWSDYLDFERWRHKRYQKSSTDCLWRAEPREAMRVTASDMAPGHSNPWRRIGTVLLRKELMDFSRRANRVPFALGNDREGIPCPEGRPCGLGANLYGSLRRFIPRRRQGR